LLVAPWMNDQKNRRSSQERIPDSTVLTLGAHG